MDIIRSKAIDIPLIKWIVRFKDLKGLYPTFEIVFRSKRLELLSNITTSHQLFKGDMFTIFIMI